MKRLTVFVLVMVLGMCSVTWAKPAFGIKAGLNFANASVDPTGDWSYGMRTLFGLGGSVEVPLNPSNQLSIRGDLMYMGKGTEATYDVQGVSGKNVESLDEIVIAPFVVYRFPMESVSLFGQAGPELGLNMVHKYKYSDNIGGSQKGNVKDYAGTNFGLNFGGGVAIPSGKGEIIVDARYNLGLSNMYTGSGSATWKTNGIQLLVGYNFSVPTYGK